MYKITISRDFFFPLKICQAYFLFQIGFSLFAVFSFSYVLLLSSNLEMKKNWEIWKNRILFIISNKGNLIFLLLY